ncbi:MAG: ATP-binding protein [Vampirovibrionales bacterium]|nr:ATP-binding protein [Vampirovibrionales bacterium]
MITSHNKFLLGAVGAISLLFIGGAILLFNQYQGVLESSYNRFGGLVTSMVASSGAEQLQGGGPLRGMGGATAQVRIQQFVDRLLDDQSDLVGVSFYDAQGNLLYENQRPNAEGMKHIRTFSARIGSPSSAGQAYLGSVNVDLSGETIQQLASGTRMLLVLVFLCAWGMTILAVSVNAWQLRQHLQRLLQGVKRLSTGDFGYKIADEDLWGELKALAQSFNDMSVRLRVYEDQNLDTITIERNKLEAVLLSIADGTIVCTSDGDIVLMNASACAHLSIDHAEAMIGRNLTEYLSVDGKKSFETLLDEYKRHRRQLSSSAPVGTFSRQIQLPEITLQVLVATIQDAEDEDLGFVITTHDVTREAQVDKIKTTFISNVSHELRTPVTTIQSYAETLHLHGDDLDEATKAEFRETLYQETDRLKRMVNDILDFSRLEEAGDKLEKTPQDITPIINLTVQSFKVLVQQKDLSITTNIESNLPLVTIHSDTIERVMRNLLSNAIKYTEEGGRIKVRAELVDDKQRGPAIEVTVQDTGIGIPKQFLGKIFDRFFRVENAVHTIRGTGLGLHLVKVAIEKHHGGRVMVDSDEGKGSTFGFRLYLDDATAPDGEQMIS